MIQNATCGALGAVGAVGVIEGKYSNTGLAVVYGVRTIPQCHEQNKEKLSCLFCKTLDNGWGVHMQQCCIMLPILCMWSFTNVATVQATQDHSIAGHSPSPFIASENNEEHTWGLPRLPNRIALTMATCECTHHPV